MPLRRTFFTENAYYHVFNRGVEKRVIFLDRQDYQVFCAIIDYYLITSTHPPLLALTRTGLVNNGLFAQSIKLIAFCLMPNHFHLLLYQLDAHAISEFFRHIGTAYAMYFNKKYHRVGSLFQGRFKAKHIGTQAYLLETSKYLHRNPQFLTRTGLVEYPWSSYPLFINPKSPDTSPIKAADPQPILEYFNQSFTSQSYQSFVENTPSPEWIEKDFSWTK